MNKEIFREYDIRGLAEEELTSENAELIGKAYGTILHNNGGGSAVIGRDNRKSSPRIAQALVKGITSTGINVVSIGEVTTPELYFAVHSLDCDGGINVTGSHNPPKYNGFKVLVGKKAIHGAEIQEIREIAGKGGFARGKGRVSEKNIDADYLNAIRERVHVKRKLRVVVDAGNGMASDLGPKLLEMLGCEVGRLYCEKLPDYPNHVPDPSQEENVRELQKKVVERKAELGIAFDGDADRIGIVDEKGRLLYGDQLLGILSKQALARKPGATIIFEVKCSQGLGEWIKKLGGRPLMWKTGHSLIKEKMGQEKAILAGEMSGHMFFALDWFGFDDALFAAAKAIEIVSQSGKSVSEMVSEMPKYYASPEHRVDFPDSKKFAFIEKAKKHFSQKYETITVDGARVIFENGWALIRASNTQPKLIIRMEGKTKSDLEKVKELFLEEIREFSGKEFKL